MKTIIRSISRRRIVTATLCLSAVLCSCSHYYYVSNVQNVPLFKDKNEYRISGSIGEGEESSSVEIQTAVSVTENVAIMANFMRASGGNLESTNYGKGNYFEGALGYFKPVKNNGVFEIYGGVGGCKQHHKYGGYGNVQYSDISDISFWKFFVQPSFDFTSNVFDIAFSTRFCRLNYYNVSVFPDSHENMNTLANGSHFFLEPAITLRVGWKRIKGQIQYVYSGYLNNTKLNFYEDTHISMGISFALGIQNQ